MVAVGAPVSRSVSEDAGGESGPRDAGGRQCVENPCRPVTQFGGDIGVLPCKALQEAKPAWRRKPGRQSRLSGPRDNAAPASCRGGQRFRPAYDRTIETFQRFPQ